MSAPEILSRPTTKLKLSSLACDICQFFWDVLYDEYSSSSISESDWQFQSEDSLESEENTGDSDGADEILSYDEGSDEIDSSIEPTWLTLSDILRGKIKNCNLCTLVYDLLELNGDSEDAGAVGFISVEHIRIDERDGLTIAYGEGGYFCKSFDLFILPEAPVQFDYLHTFNDISEDPLTDDCQHKILGWIEECITTHAVCSSTALVQAPKRLIDVGETDEYCPRLVSPPPPESPKYAALTHCWGNSNPSSTTRSNLVSRYHGIPLMEIPRTFKDAMKVTRWLGLKYLWIDSFCIVQDNIMEWETEAAKMADIYSGSWVVIAAAQAKDSSAGFLKPRETAGHIALKLSHGTAVDVCVRKTISHETSSVNRIPYQLSLAPLLSRAWCFQERILAPRVLYFDEREYFFHCQKEEKCECGSVSQSEENLPDIRWLGLHMDSKNPHFHFGILWGTIVQEYSGLKLTYESDRLPALAGVAQLVERFNPGRYIAGMWEKDLPYQLLWYIQIGSGISMPSVNEPLPRADIYNPSFSWISWTRQVFYGALPDDFLVACEVVEVYSVIPGANMYGQVSYAHIRIRGLLTSLKTIHSRICLLEDMPFNRETVLPSWNWERRPHISYNFRHKNDWDKLFFFKLLTSRNSAWNNSMENKVSGAVCGLILQKTDFPGTYRRFGVAVYIPESWIDSNTASTVVTIV